MYICTYMQQNYDYILSKLFTKKSIDMSKGALVIQERQVTMGLHTVMIPYYNLLIFPPILVTFLPFFLHIYKDIVMSLLFSKQRHYNLIDLGQIQAPSYTCYMTLNKLLSPLPPPLSTRRTYCWKQPKCPPVNEWIKNCGTFTQWNTMQQKERRNSYLL